MPRPLVLDIDGTLTRADTDRSPAPVDPRMCARLDDWKAPVIFATGKAFPMPVALCEFIGLDRRIIAETGGVVCVGEELDFLGDGTAARVVAEEMTDRGHPPSPGGLNLINRWRETEVAFKLDAPLELLKEVAERHGLHVVDTGYAYHVKDPSVSKGLALERVASLLDRDLSTFVAIGDSVNDVSLFERVGRAIAVANADHVTQAAADEVTTSGYADGVLEMLESLEAT